MFASIAKKGNAFGGAVWERKRQGLVATLAPPNVKVSIGSFGCSVGLYEFSLLLIVSVASPTLLARTVTSTATVTRPI